MYSNVTSSVPEFIDQVFAKTSPKRSFSMTEYERFRLVFTKTRVYKFGHCFQSENCSAQTRTKIGHLRKPPGVEMIPCRRKPLRHTRTLRDRRKCRYEANQVWLDTTFISQGSRSWGKLAVET